MLPVGRGGFPLCVGWHKNISSPCNYRDPITAKLRVQFLLKTDFGLLPQYCFLSSNLPSVRTGFPAHELDTGPDSIGR